MAFRGLFIGIDRYASPGVSWLSCAGRDAKALYALFTDSFGGETTLLLDDQAMVAEIGRRFDALSACDPEDVVVIAFSGHGTNTHELVTHDTDPRDLARTTIPLTALGEWCARTLAAVERVGSRCVCLKLRSSQPSCP
jgi:helicase